MYIYIYIYIFFFLDCQHSNYYVRKLVLKIVHRCGSKSHLKSRNKPKSPKHDKRCNISPIAFGVAVIFLLIYGKPQCNVYTKLGLHENKKY